jgi:serine/threonine-protein phosphatase Stp1
LLFDCVSRSHPGLRRKINEDSLLVRNERGLWVVADGMGGHEAGEVASAKVVEALDKVGPDSNLEEYVAGAIDALNSVNHQLIELARSGDHPRTIGSTVVGLTLSEGRFGCFWAGDSRAYRLREGEIAQLSRDHSLVQSLVDAGMLDPAEAEHHPDANVVTRAVGATPELAVETTSGDVRTGDRFLLASDGLTRVVNDESIYSEIMSASLESAADTLIELVLARGAPDNVSLIIVKVR